MIIAINGNLIDTKNIYKIDKIYFSSEYEGYCFNINFFNDKTLWIGRNVYNINKSSVKVDGITIFCFKIESDKKEEWVNTHAPELLEMITGFRNQIVKVWSENQPEIPQFNL